MKAAAKIAVLAIIMALFANQNAAAEPAPKPPPRTPLRKPVKLPGLVIDFQKRCVDLEATICLDRGYLELIACTKGSKEHESIVSIKARPMHVHTALLFLGATNGNPAMRKSVDEEKMRWVNHPPRGDPINVYLVVKNSKGELVERPVSDFVTRSKERTGEIADDDERGPKEGADKDNKFPHTFLFAGSHLRDNGKGPRQYLADLSGHVISVATFGDELLCLPDVQSHANGALMWQVDSTHLPKVGTMVTLRLRPKKDERTGAKK